MALLAMIRAPQYKGVYIGPGWGPAGTLTGGAIPYNPGTPDIGYVNRNIEGSPFDGGITPFPTVGAAAIPVRFGRLRAFVVYAVPATPPPGP